MAKIGHEGPSPIDPAIIAGIDAADLSLPSISQPTPVPSPDFSAMVEANRVAKVIQSLNPNPDLADFYIREGALSLPDDFKEPAPFVLSSEQWELYQRRIKHIESRRREAMSGYEYNG